MKTKLTSLTREPLVQFLIIGACIYSAYGWFGTPDDEAPDNTVVVDAARIQAFAGQWQQRWNRPPTPEELDGVIAAFVRETILYRAAVEMGLDKDDPITRRRMAQKLEFLTNDIARVKEPGPGELEQYFEDNQTDYREPDRVSFVQVFFDPDKRGDATLDDATTALARLGAAGEPGPETLDAGDRNMSQSYFRDASELDIRRQLGTGFAESVMTLDAGRWHGPVLSGFGTHLVYVYARNEAAPPAFADVREAVLADWQKHQQDEFNEAFFESLKTRYEVVIDEVPDGIVLDTSSIAAEDKVAGPAS